MLPEVNDSENQLSKYLAWKGKDEAKSIPSKDKQEKPSVKEDENKVKIEPPEWKDKKNDDYNNYEYSENPDEDDRNW